MYSKPEIMEKMELTRASCRAELEFWNNVTFLVESAGSAKELVFDMIRQASKKDGRILCISAEGKMESAEVRRRIRQAERKMIVIEHADILLTDEMRRYIALIRQTSTSSWGEIQTASFCQEPTFMNWMSHQTV